MPLQSSQPTQREPRASGPRLYIGNTWSVLGTAERRKMRSFVRQLAAAAKKHGISTFSSVQLVPTASLDEIKTRELWFRLRKEMATSHAFLLVHAGTSEGGTAELRNADDNRVPLVLLQRADNSCSDLTWSPSLECLARLSYDSEADALETWLGYLEANAPSFYQQAVELDNWRRALRSVLAASDTISWLREMRGLSISDLAERARLTEAEVLAIEDDIVAYAPPVTHIAAIAVALEASLSSLSLPPREWLRNYVDVLVTEVALKQGLSVPLIEEFRLSRWQSYRPDITEWPTDEDIEAEINAWIEERMTKRLFEC